MRSTPPNYLRRDPGDLRPGCIRAHLQPHRTSTLTIHFACELWLWASRRAVWPGIGLCHWHCRRCWNKECSAAAATIRYDGIDTHLCRGSRWALQHEVIEALTLTENTRTLWAHRVVHHQRSCQRRQRNMLGRSTNFITQRLSSLSKTLWQPGPRIPCN